MADVEAVASQLQQGHHHEQAYEPDNVQRDVKTKKLQYPNRLKGVRDKLSSKNDSSKCENEGLCHEANVVPDGVDGLL